MGGWVGDGHLGCICNLLRFGVFEDVFWGRLQHIV